MSPVVLVTGASSGIGAATAHRLAACGMRVFGTSRRVKMVSQKIEWEKLDVREENSVTNCITNIINKAGKIDGLVCNAGYGIFGSVEEVGLADVISQFETNVFGVLRCIRAILPAMRERGAGRIVIVGSLAGRAPIPYQAHYSATKAAVDALAQSLAMESAPFGIRVSLIEPGDIKTDFNNHVDWTATDTSVYKDRIRRSAHTVKESLLTAPSPDVVARAIEHALIDPNPRFRYSVGPDSWNVPLARRFLPEKTFHQLIMRRFLGR